MTATTLPVAATARTGRRGVTFGGVVAGEWTKLTSLRSPWWTAAASVVVAGAVTYASAAASSSDPGFDPVGDLTTGLQLAQVGPLVLGVLVGAGEYRTGAFRSTFAAVPRRWPVLAAQAVVTAVFALLTGLLVTAASVVALLPSAAARDLPVDLTGDGTPSVLVGMVLHVVAMALLGLAAGALTRRTVPALVGVLVLVLVLPVVILLAGDLGTDPMAPYDPTVVTAAGVVTTFLPGGAAQLMLLPPGSGPIEGSPDLGALGGGLVVAAWVLVPLAVAAVRLRTRDAA